MNERLVQKYIFMISECYFRTNNFPNHSHIQIQNRHLRIFRKNMYFVNVLRTNKFHKVFRNGKVINSLNRYDKFFRRKLLPMQDT